MSASLIALVGATGTGKSSLAIELAKRFAEDSVRAEIVNADAMQLYRGMDIGTAKLNLQQREGIPHHLIDVLEITQESTAAEYQKLARAKILELQAAKVLPILVGGSMLYVAAALNEFEFPARDETLRAQLEAELERIGPIALHRKLQDLDPVAASRIIAQNGRRIVRALEIVMLTGEPFAAELPQQINSWQPVIEIGLAMPREELLPRLTERVVGMWEAGLVEEVSRLSKLGLREGKTASVAIGYAAALGQLDGELTEQEAIAQTVRLTQRYARRQVSWFKRDYRINWLSALDEQLVDLAYQLARPAGLSLLA